MNLQKWITRFVLCQCMIAIGMVSSAQAQTNVAIVDIGLIFKNHPEFTQRLEQLKRQADEFKATAQQTQQQFIQRAEVLNNYEKDSQEYRDIEAKLAKESAELEVTHRAKMRDMLTAEAELHHRTYNEVKQFVSQYCDERGIKLVLRYNSEAMSEDNPRTIMQQVNGFVVYSRNDKDITTAIIQRISQVKGSAQRPSNTTNR